MLSNSSINLTISAAKVRLIFDMTKYFAEKKINTPKVNLCGFCSVL